MNKFFCVVAVALTSGQALADTNDAEPMLAGVGLAQIQEVHANYVTQKRNTSTPEWQKTKCSPAPKCYKTNFSCCKK